MGYFNYFIKCLIRNFARQVSKPKVFLTVLLSILILFGLRYYGFCSEWTDGEIEACLDGISVITQNQGVIISQLSSVGVDVTNLKNSLSQIQSQLSAIQNNQATIATQINDLYRQIQTLNTNILNIYNTLEENQKELITELQTENEKILNELKNIKNLLSGGETEINGVKLTPFKVGDLTPNINWSGEYQFVSGTPDAGFCSFNYEFEKGYIYNISCSSSTTNLFSALFGTMDTVSIGGSTFYMTFLYSGQISSASFSYTPSKNGTLTIIANNPAALNGTTWTIIKKSSSSLSGINSTIEQGNQLQQQQNQLQQDQNNFLKDDNVSADSSTLPTDTTEDITSDGFNNIFQQLYTTFTSGSAKDVVITIPFTNKSFIINSSTVYGGANLGFIKTLIEMFWYFVISYFIVQDVGNKINKIKSGDIEHVQDNNIKEDLL